MPSLRRLAAFLVIAVPLVAQNFRPNPRGTTLTHIHLNSANPDAAIAFWTEFIGASSHSQGSVKGVRMLGAMLLFSANAPSGPSAGSAIDHIALRVPDLQTFVEKLAKSPYKSFTPPENPSALMIDGPDGVRIELTEDATQYSPLDFGHVHIYTSSPKEAQAWYADVFGARSGGPDEQANTSRVTGGVLMFTAAKGVAPSAGRAIDHIAFEVKDLPGLCEKLASGSVNCDPPKGAAEGKAVFLTDPWGTRIELTNAIGQ